MNLGKKVVAIGGAGGTSGPITASSITDAGTAGIAVLQAETTAQVREVAETTEESIAFAVALG